MKRGIKVGLSSADLETTGGQRAIQQLDIWPTLYLVYVYKNELVVSYRGISYKQELRVLTSSVHLNARKKISEKYEIEF